jgi:hypothetical protein
MGALFLVGNVKLFEAVGFKSDLPTLLALAAGVVFFLPPSTSQMILVCLSLLVTALASLPIIDVNTALVYGLLAIGVPLVFWVITGIWGWLMPIAIFGTSYKHSMWLEMSLLKVIKKMST